LKAMIDTRQPIIVLPDGKPRCGWAGMKGCEWLSYHDDEWGTPTRNQVSLFEALSLTIFEGGLSWEAVFRRRAGFRRAFHGFEPARVAAMTSRDVDALLADRTIIRNRRKIEATVHNARRAITGPPLPGLVWACAQQDGESGTRQAAQLARLLKREGYALAGPVVAHAFMQSAGIINGHFAGCFRERRNLPHIPATSSHLTSAGPAAGPGGTSGETG
jgi:DNA-3-methyladenine glycosylase I